MAAPRSFASGAFACLLVAIAVIGPVRAACHIAARLTVPLEIVNGLMVVSVTVNGTPSPFLLDTGSERTVIGTQAALALNLARDEWVSTDIRGLGGRERQRLGRPRSLTLGGLTLRRNTVAADNTVVVGTIPTEVGGHSVAGLLGQDFLSVFDLDLDPARGRMTLYDVTGCVGSFLPWKEPYAGLQATRLVRNILALPVTVGGEALNAELDTGAQLSVLLAPGMQRLGLLPGGNDRLRGFGPGGEMGRLQRFAVKVGGETSDSMPLMLTQGRSLRSIDMLLGADWLSERHVWISWATDQVMVSRAVKAP